MDREPVVVRAAEPGDAEQLNEIYNHYVRTSHVTFDIEPMSLDRRREWLRERSGGSHRVLVAHHAKRVLGFASSGPHRDRPAYATTVETTVDVDPGCTGRGIGTALYDALFEALREQDLHRAIAGIALPNPASVALHRCFGFTEVGIFTEQGASSAATGTSRGSSDHSPDARDGAAVPAPSRSVASRPDGNGHLGHVDGRWTSRVN